MIRHFLNHYRNYQARKRLAELVAHTRNSREHRNYLDRRRAALKGLALKRERQHNG